MKKRYIILLFIIVLILISYGNIAIHTKPSTTEYINLFLIINQTSSNSIEGNNISFYSPAGKQIAGNTIITNNGDKENSIKVQSEGQLSEKGWLEINETSFKLQPKESRSIKITIKIPSNASGNYTSRISIKSK